MSSRNLAILSCSRFNASVLIFRSLICFNFNVVHGEKHRFKFNLHHVQEQFFQYHLLKSLSFIPAYVFGTFVKDKVA